MTPLNFIITKVKWYEDNFEPFYGIPLQSIEDFDIFDLHMDTDSINQLPSEEWAVNLKDPPEPQPRVPPGMRSDTWSMN